MKKIISSIPAGAWVALAVTLVVGGQWGWKWAHCPRYLDTISKESGNLNFMLENERPQVSHNGSRVLFCHSSENGVGVFVSDVESGQKKMLFEEQEIHFGMGPHGVLAPFPWSPDDRWFVYAHQGPGGINAETAVAQETVLTICRSDSDAEEASLTAPFGRVVALEWLTTNAFVYVAGTEGNDFMLVQRAGEDQWRQTKLNTSGPVREGVRPTTNDNHFCALAAISDDTITWLQANCLWRMNVLSNQTEKVCDLPKDKFFTSFDYSKETGQVLLSAIESKNDSLWQMPMSEPANLAKVASDVRTHDNLWNDARWINGGRGYAFIRKPGLQASGLVIKKGAAAKQTILFPNTLVQYFIPTADEQKIFVVGDLEKQPGSAIWEYDLDGGLRHCVAAGSDGPLKHLAHVPIHYENIRISNDEHLTVVVFPPVNMATNSDKKYPVVIGSIRFVMEDPYLYQYPEAVANAGGWFVMIDHGWSPKSLGSWGWHIDNLASFMAQSPKQFPNVDRKRIFVLSNSAQSYGLAQLFTNHPSLWRGAILQACGESGFPTASDASAGRHLFKTLLTAESRNAQSQPAALMKYQEACTGEGMMVDWIIHPDTPHEFVAKKSQRDRIGSMLHFIFDE